MTFYCEKCKKAIPYNEEAVGIDYFGEPQIKEIKTLEWYNETNREIGGPFVYEHPEKGSLYYHLDCYTKDEYINEERTRIYIARLLNLFIDPLNLKEKELYSHHIEINSIKIKPLLKELLLICLKFKVDLKQKKSFNKFSLVQRYIKKVGHAYYFHIPKEFFDENKLSEETPYELEIIPQKRAHRKSPNFFLKKGKTK